MNKKCPDCGSLNVEEVFDGESYCKDCFLHCATADLEDASYFDRITVDEETLAKEFVEKQEDQWDDDDYAYYSYLTKEWYATESKAIAATVAKLKEVAE